MATNRSDKSICYQTCLSSWILSVIVWLLYTVVSSKHLTSILEVVILRHLRNNWFEIKRMRTTVCTRRSSSPLLQIGTPGYEASKESVEHVVFECASYDSQRQKFFDYIMKQILTPEAFEAFNHNSIFDKLVFCLGEKQGTLVNAECSSWYNTVGDF